MGGSGSGPRESGKDLVETCTSIDIRQWQRQGLLDPESCFRWCWQEAGVTVASISVHVKTELVVLTYKARWPGREGQDIDERIGLSFSSCHLWRKAPVVRLPQGGVWPGGRGFVPIWPPVPVPPLPFTSPTSPVRGAKKNS
jgi:hypothetical protein